MLRQRRGSAPAPATPPAGSRSTPAGPSARRAQARRRLSFRDKHALETLPSAIDALQAEISAERARLADPAFFRRDPAAFAAAAEKLQTAERRLAEAEAEWLRLELLREAIEG
jgi:ATP-binding cassette subfamily F protein uup